MGAALDGGYVLSRRIVGATKGLLSFGLNDEWEFEAEFSKAAGVPVVCYDPSVTGAFWAKRMAVGLGKGIMGLDRRRLRRGLRVIDYKQFFDGKRHRHVRKAIGFSGPRSLTLDEAIADAALPAPLFLKMDIEGWEYRILDQIVARRSEFVGLAIEFHDVDLHEKRIVDFIAAISDELVLIHFHANSHCILGPEQKSVVIELSFMAKSLLAEGEQLVAHALPIAGLDAPNLPGEREAVVSFSVSTS